MAKTFNIPLYHGADRFEEIPSGQYIDPALVPVSDDEGNAVKVKGDGLYVETPGAEETTVVSEDGGNVISKGSDGGALLTKTALDALTQVYLLQNPIKRISDNENNLLRLGSDSAAYLTADDVLSNGDVNLLTVHPTDRKVILNEKTLLDNIQFVSDIDCNLVGKDSEGRFYLCADDIIADGDPFLYVDGDGRVASEATLSYDTSDGTFSLVNHAGETVTSVTVTPSVAVLKNVELEKDGGVIYMVYTFLLADGSEKELKVDMTDLVDVYKAGDGLKLEDGTFSVDLAQTGHLYVNQNGRLAVDAGSLASPAEDNALVDDGDGLYVMSYKAGNALSLSESNTFHVKISSQDGNRLSVTNDALYVPETTASGLISKDVDNAVKLGSDDGLFVCLDCGTME